MLYDLFSKRVNEKSKKYPRRDDRENYTTPRPARRARTRNTPRCVARDLRLNSKKRDNTDNANLKTGTR